MPSVATLRPHSNDLTSRAIAALLLATWFITAGWLLWYFETQRHAESQQLFYFDAQHLPPAPQSSVAGAKALYFLADNCRCGDAALKEIEELQRIAGSRLTHFVMADSDSSLANNFVTAPSTPIAIKAQQLSAQEQASWREHVPPTPAVALWDEHDTLIYFGPIASSAECGVSRSYLLSAWHRFVNDQATTFTAWDVVACACRARNAV